MVFYNWFKNYFTILYKFNKLYFLNLIFLLLLSFLLKGFVIRHFFGNLKKSCAVPCLNTVLPWINDQHPGRYHGVNVIIADFVELNNAVFSKTIIDLNYKLEIQK